MFSIEKIKRGVEQDKTIERFKLFLQSTPIFSENNKFSASSVDVFATKFNYENKEQNLILSMVIGFVVGVLYVLVLNKLQSVKVLRNTN